MKLEYYSDKKNVFIQKKNKLGTYQKEEFNDLTIDTKCILKNVFTKKNSNSSRDLSSEENARVNGNPNKNSKSYLEIQKNNFSNSSLSTADNSVCTTPISSPESDVKKTLNGNIENMIFSNQSTSNKNLFECFFEDVNNNSFGGMNNNDTLKICHINSFFTNFEIETKNKSLQNFYMNNNNFINSAGNKAAFNSRVNSVNNNSNSNHNFYNQLSTLKKPVYPLNPNVFYDTTNITNNSLINNSNYIPPTYNNICQVPIYQNKIFYNNFNMSTSAQSYIPKKAKYVNDPLKALRDQTNCIIRTSNGKAIPFEEPHNRINLENVNFNKIFY